MALDFPKPAVAQLVKNPPAVQETGAIPGSETCAGEGIGSPLQYSGLENSMDCRVHGVANCRTQLRDFHFPFQTSIRCRKTNGEDNWPTDDLPCADGAQDPGPGPPPLRESALVAEGELGWPVTRVYSISAILPFFTHGSFCSAGR